MPREEESIDCVLRSFTGGVKRPPIVVTADTEALRVIAEQRDGVDAALVEAVRSARAADRSWSEIGAMLGVSKQAAQRKYSKLVSA